MTPERYAANPHRWRRPVIALALGVSVAGTGLAAGAIPASAATPTKVTASLTEFKIGLSKTKLSPGSYTFVAKNNGKIVHALEITGPGVTGKKTAVLSPGQSANLNVTFKKGKYDVFCPVPGHQALGMNVNLTVKSGGGTASTSGSSSSGSSGSGGSSGGGAAF